MSGRGPSGEMLGNVSKALAVKPKCGEVYCLRPKPPNVPAMVGSHCSKGSLYRLLGPTNHDAQGGSDPMKAVRRGVRVRGTTREKRDGG